MKDWIIQFFCSIGVEPAQRIETSNKCKFEDKSESETMPSTSKQKRLAERKAAAAVGQGKETSPGPEKKKSKADNCKPMEVDKQEASTEPKATNTQPEGEEESDDLSESTTAAGNGAKKLSQKFENDLKRKHVEFWDIQFRAGKGTNGVALTRAAVMEIFKLLQEIDSTTLLYKYKQTEETEKDALIKPKSLPSAMNRLQEYFSVWELSLVLPCPV